MDLDTRYQAALDYLYSFVDYSLTRQLTYSPEKFNLNRMFRVLELLGNPHKRYPCVHITGTKGKGSVCAFTASILKEAGYKVGLFTSPHLIEYTERIQINGVPVSREAFVEQLEQVKPLVDEVPGLTTFEITTALAMLVFANQEINIAVFEVGLGGRLDATNVVDPIVSVITTISYDHQSVLGNTLTQIAGEKAGIIKPGKPVVTSNQTGEAMEVIERVANEKGSSLRIVGRDAHYASVSHSLEGQTFWLWSPDQQKKMDAYLDQSDPNWKPAQFEVPLLGAHQLENATTAYLAIQALNEAGMKFTDQAIHEGLRRVQWPCRFEVVSKKPMVVLDSAHNRDSAQKLRITLDDYLPGRNVILLFGASEDKDVRGILTDLLPRVSQIITTQTIHPRAMDASTIVQLVHQMGKPARAILPFEEAYQTAVSLAGDDQVVLVAGSIFMAAAAREYWLKTSGT
jgi:dihydrofolate synthase/folylpolyglutamate synthase